MAHWGDPAELRVGDELLILPRREIHPRPSPVRFLHTTLTAFLAERKIQWTPSHPWRNVMVGEGFVAPGFSGSPWVRDGRVYGLTKGWVRPPGAETRYAAAESTPWIQRCLDQLHYEDLIPRGGSP